MDTSQLTNTITESMKTGLTMGFKMIMPYLLIFTAIMILIAFFNAKIDQRNLRRKKQREQEEFERKVGIYLKMKDTHESTKNKRK